MTACEPNTEARGLPLWLRAADEARAYQRLLDLLRNGLLDIRAIRPRVYPLAALPEAMEAAATAGSL